MKKTCAIYLFIFFAPAAFGASLDSIAKQLLGPGEIATLKGQSVAIVTASDSVSTDFSFAFENVLKKHATIVQNDHSITQGEIARQESGLVDDKQVARYGKEKGAETVIQLMLTRVAGTSKVKVQMKGVSVEGNYLVVSGVVTETLPGSYNLALLPVPRAEASAQVKAMTNKIVDAKVNGIYDEPYKPPKPPKPPREPIKLPELPKIDWNVLTDDAWWGVYPNVTVWSGKSKDEEKTLTGFRTSLEYGRIKNGYYNGSGFCLELSAISIFDSKWGFDINAGYAWWWDFDWTYNVIPMSFIVSGGFAYMPNDIFSEYIPYIQVKLQCFVFLSGALRISLVEPHIGFSYGLNFQYRF